MLWGGEFGRTPVSESGTGRDHNPYGFTMWAAGGGFQGGVAYGATDEFGFQAVENRVSIHDLHATLLYALGIDHTAYTARWRNTRRLSTEARLAAEDEGDVGPVSSSPPNGRNEPRASTRWHGPVGASAPFRC